MTFNYDNTDTCYWLLDNTNMVVRRPYNWEVYPDCCDRGDALLNNSLCSIAYENNERLLQGIESCIDSDFIWRHPDRYRDDTSRDQLIGLITCLTILGKEELLTKVLNQLKFRISYKFVQSADMYLWQKALKKKSKTIAFIHNLWVLPGLVIKREWNSLLSSIAGFTDKTYAEYQPTPESALNRLQIAIKRILFPSYAFDKLCWQLYTIPANPLKNYTKKVALKWAERTNYVHRMLLGDKVTKEEIDSYTPMTGYRWSARLNETSSRTTFLDKKYKYNLKDVAILHKVYELTQK